MSKLVENLKRFNRKERYWVVQTALGESAAQRLCPSFLARLSEQLGEAVPADAWWAMDYHLDWLAAALTLQAGRMGNQAGAWPNQVLDDDRRLITGTQEDIDLLIAYGDTVVLVEAKADTAWGNAQVSSKLRRLAAMQATLGDDCLRDVRLVLMSPERPRKLVNGADGAPWPAYMRRRDGSGQPMWVPLTMGANGRSGFSAVTRCDEKGQPSATGEFWRVLDRAGVASDDSVLPAA